MRTAQVATSNTYSSLSDDLPPDPEEQPADEHIRSASCASSSDSVRDNTIVARGQMDGLWCDDMLIDTGASCCFVRRSWVQSTRLPMEPLPKPIVVNLADKSTVRSTHQVLLKQMAVHGSAAACPLLVMDELSNAVIVGLSWQRAARLSITLGSEHDLLNGQRVARKQRRPKPRAQTPARPVPAPTPTESGPTRVRLAAVLCHLTRAAAAQEAARREKLNAVAEECRSATIDEAAVGNQRLKDVLQRHQRVFTEVLPIKTAEQIAQSKQFSVVLVGDTVRPVKQRERRVSPAEIEAATQWVREEVAAGRMEPSTSEWAAQLVIVPKRNDKGEVSGWRICGDYRNLNDVTKADAEPLPLMQSVFDQLKGMQYFSKLDLLKGFNQIPVEPKSREYMAVSTPVGLYQPTVMPFGVKNAPGSFQREMRRVLSGLLNKGVFVFVDDIIIYSRTEAEHIQLIDAVLSRLEKYGYYANPGKCEFLRSEVSFLGHMVSREGVSMQQHKVEAVRNWPTLQSVRDVRAFLGLAGFYRRFVRNFAAIAQPLTDLTKIVERQWWSWGAAEQKAFDALKQALTSAPLLVHPDPQRQWTVQTDASGYAIGAVLSQKQDDDTLRPVAFWSHKLNSAARNYSATERELMAIVEAVRQWRAYLHGSPYPVLLKSDHKPLVYLNSKQQLGQRLSRWMEELCDLTFEIGYVKGKDNAVADALSRRSDHETKGAEAAEPATLRVKLMSIRQAGQTSAPQLPSSRWQKTSSWLEQPTQWLATARRAKTTDESKSATPADAVSERSEAMLCVESLLTDARDAVRTDPQYQLMLSGDEKHDGLQRRDGLVYSRSGAVYVPNDRRLRTRLLALAHDAAGHFGRARTIERLSRHCLWSNMSREVEDYCRSCAVCAANKGSNEMPAGLLQPLPIPSGVWESVGVDFVGPLPQSTEGNDCILVLVDRFSKMVKLRPCKKTITAVQTGRLLLDMLLEVGKLPSSIISDRDVRFTGAVWGQLWRGLKTELKMSTAYHPQTDGQTERMNRTMQTVLRSYCEQRKDWQLWLPFVAAAYNSTQQESTKRTPFELNFPDRRAIDPLQWAMSESKGDSRGVSAEAERTLVEMRAIWDETRARLVQEQAKQKKYADLHRRDVTYEVGDQVMLSTHNIKSMAGKLQDKWVGPYEVKEVRSAGKSVLLDLKGELGKTHPVFHVSRVRLKEEPQLDWPGRQQEERPAPELIEGVAEWEIEKLVGKKIVVRDVPVTTTVQLPPEERKGADGRVLRSKKATKEVTTATSVSEVQYKVRWLGWDEDDDTWMSVADLPHAKRLIKEYELLAQQSDTRYETKAGAAAVVELGLATRVEWHLQNKATTSRRGQPTVRCSYLCALAA